MLRLEALCKEYREGAQVRRVLSDVSARIRPGEAVAVRGKSGSGKSTLLNLAAGLDAPTSGRVFVNDVCITDLKSHDRTLFRRDHIGFVFQFFNLIPTLTALENVRLPAELAGIPTAEASSRAGRLLEQVGLVERESTFPDKLSGGEQQRVAIARALVRDPDLVLADEPTGNLDEASGQVVLELLDGMTRRVGKTLLLVTHSRRVAAMADRVLAIQDGRLVEDGTFGGVVDVYDHAGK